VSRRAEIVLTDGEIAQLLDEQRTLICATIGRDGWPHLMPLWYVVRDGECWAWTYAKSQKVRNLERDPRCTVQVETGERYEELRGVMLKCSCELVRDVDAVAALGAEIAARYGGGALTDDVRAAMRKQAVKRVGLHFVVRETASWDHRKLGGGY
jgi:PPOX class probable F420-dependent enzyme